MRRNTSTTLATGTVMMETVLEDNDDVFEGEAPAVQQFRAVPNQVSFRLLTSPFVYSTLPPPTDSYLLFIKRLYMCY